MIEMELPGTDGFDLDALLHFLAGIVGGAEHASQTREQGLDLRA